MPAAASSRSERLVGDPGVGLPGADLVVGLDEVGAEVAQQPQPGVEQLRADRGEVVVPDVEGVQRRRRGRRRRPRRRAAAGGELPLRSTGAADFSRALRCLRILS